MDIRGTEEAFKKPPPVVGEIELQPLMKTSQLGNSNPCAVIFVILVLEHFHDSHCEIALTTSSMFSAPRDNSIKGKLSAICFQSSVVYHLTSILERLFGLEKKSVVSAGIGEIIPVVPNERLGSFYMSILFRSVFNK